MITSAAAAYLSYASYYDQSAFDKHYAADQVDACMRRLSGVQCLVYPGSRTPTDWLRDIMSASLVNDPDLGAVGKGFVIGVRQIITLATADIDKTEPLTIIGHSLGAARAILTACLLLKAGFDPSLLQVIVFGSPCPGGPQLADILKPAAQLLSYCNGHDAVCKILTLDPGFAHPIPLTPVLCEPVVTDPLPMGANYHHMQLYRATFC